MSPMDGMIDAERPLGSAATSGVMAREMIALTPTFHYDAQIGMPSRIG
jgi:hypothetical protein